MISDYFSDIHPEVKAIYEKYQVECEQYFVFPPPLDSPERKYYVYAWYADTTPKRYFYVGKGTGSRLYHIRSEIKRSEKGANNIRWERYKMIQEKWGIAYDILLDGLTEFEALIFEECKKLEFLAAGEVLLNVEGIPSDYLPEGWYPINKTDGNTPVLQKDPFYTKFLDDYTVPYFDKVQLEGLQRTYIYPYFLDPRDEKLIYEQAEILRWLCCSGSRIYKTVSPKTKSIIIQGFLMYDRYSVYRSQGKLIYSAKDVVEFINKHPI